MNGSIYDLDNGRVRVRWRDLDDRNRSRTFDERREAQQWLAKVRYLTSIYETPEIPSLTVKEFVDEWLPLKSKELRPRSAADYEQILRLHVLPVIGGRLIRSVSALDVIRLLDAAVRSPRKIRLTMSLVFNAAIMVGLIDSNPVAGVRASNLAVRSIESRECPSPDDVRQLAGVAKPWAAPVILVAGFSGLRWGEIVAPRQVDIDLERAEIRVTKALDDTTRVIGPPKTRSSRRTVVIDPSIIDVLAQYLQTVGESEWAFPSAIPTST